MFDDIGGETKRSSGTSNSPLEGVGIFPGIAYYNVWLQLPENSMANLDVVQVLWGSDTGIPIAQPEQRPEDW